MTFHVHLLHKSRDVFRQQNLQTLKKYIGSKSIVFYHWFECFINNSIVDLSLQGFLCSLSFFQLYICLFNLKQEHGQFLCSHTTMEFKKYHNIHIWIGVILKSLSTYYIKYMHVLSIWVPCTTMNPICRLIKILMKFHTRFEKYWNFRVKEKDFFWKIGHFIWILTFIKSLILLFRTCLSSNLARSHGFINSIESSVSSTKVYT